MGDKGWELGEEIEEGGKQKKLRWEWRKYRGRESSREVENLCYIGEMRDQRSLGVWGIRNGRKELREITHPHNQSIDNFHHYLYFLSCSGKKVGCDNVD